MSDVPEAYYRMQEASGLIQDSSGNARHATASSGTPTYGQASPVITDPTAKAISFSSAYFRIPDFNLGDAFAFEMWFNRTSLGTTVVPFSLGGANSPVWFFDSANSNKLSIAKSGASVLAASTITPSATTWYHAVWSKADAVNNIYIDGVDRTGTVTDQTMANTGEEVYIGSDWNGTFTYSGLLTEVAFYNEPLSAARVLAHYNAALTDTQYTYKNMQIVRSNLRW
jgi:hypothetical protein